ncbi:uncharacterized protein VTP21DRAFT_3014 [Calcarisporiella thermophila]|uniref:uncharacterized protein n=1 Tax=Calcarisporiella thermophila TaxID=911321 RepID=UPI003743E164
MPTKAKKTLALFLPVCVVAFFIYGFVVYNGRICARILEAGKKGQAISYIIVFNVLFLLALYCFVRTALREPGHPRRPPRSRLQRHMNPDLSSSPLTCQTTGGSHSSLLPAIPSVDVSMPTLRVCKRDGQSRFCTICQCFKPDRCHHCSECEQCVLKMDHHCPWINGCIGFGNYKLFVLFILYTAILCVFTVATTAVEVAQDFEQTGEMNVLVILLCLLAGIFALLLTGFTAMHLTYTLINKTTIEALAENQPIYLHVAATSFSYTIATSGVVGLWDLGRKLNWVSVMGRPCWLWFVPVANSIGDGMSFPYNPEVFRWALTEAERKSRERSVTVAEEIESPEGRGFRPDGGEESEPEDEYTRVY